VGVNMPDTTRPYIKSTTPGSNAQDVTITPHIAIEFSERMKTSTVNINTIGMFEDPLVQIAIDLVYNDSINLATITPVDILNINTRYSLVVSGNIQDYSGNSMGMDYSWNFWTGEPSGYIHASGVQDQPDAQVDNGYLQVVSTTPPNYTTNIDTDSLDNIKIVLDAPCLVGKRNSYGGVNYFSGIYGKSFYEDVNKTLTGYVDISNQEVLGNPTVDHTPPTYSIYPSGNILVIEPSGMLDNNEYIITVGSGLPGVEKNPLQSDYQFVFTTTYTPLYTGANVIRLNIGPLLQMTMSYIPDDTLNRFIYESSLQAYRLCPITIDPTDVPWFVEEFVIYQTKLNALYAAIMLFASSGAGIKKQLGDLSISIDGNGIMPLLLPIIEDYRKLRDKYLGFVIAGSDRGPSPTWAVRSMYDTRGATWQRLPFKDYRNGGSSNTSYTISDGWLYTRDISQIQYATEVNVI
jgi:hypothetical protein